MAEFSSMERAHCPCVQFSCNHFLCTQTEKTAILTPFTYKQRAAISGFFSCPYKIKNRKSYLPFVYFSYICASFMLPNRLKSLLYICRIFVQSLYNILIFNVHKIIIYYLPIRKTYLSYFCFFSPICISKYAFIISIVISSFTFFKYHIVRIGK